MPSTDRKLELKAKTSVAQTGSQPFVYAKGLNGIRPVQTLVDIPSNTSVSAQRLFERNPLLLLNEGINLGLKYHAVSLFIGVNFINC
jgi:hypothetical protein